MAIRSLGPITVDNSSTPPPLLSSRSSSPAHTGTEANLETSRRNQRFKVASCNSAPRSPKLGEETNQTVNKTVE